MRIHEQRNVFEARLPRSNLLLQAGNNSEGWIGQQQLIENNSPKLKSFVFRNQAAATDFVISLQRRITSAKVLNLWKHVISKLEGGWHQSWPILSSAAFTPLQKLCALHFLMRTVFRHSRHKSFSQGDSMSLRRRCRIGTSKYATSYIKLTWREIKLLLTLVWWSKESCGIAGNTLVNSNKLWYRQPTEILEGSQSIHDAYTGGLTCHT